MISSLTGTLRWTCSLGAKFARVVPFATLFIIGLTLVSQIAMLVASLLPLKVVILLGSERIPSYFPSFLSAYGLDGTIILLSVITVSFFMIHLFAERLITWSTRRAADRLLRMSQKMTLFERQDVIAQDAYQRFSRALASGVFVISALAGLGFFYPSMMAIQLGYMLLVLLLLWLYQHINDAFRERLESRPAPILTFSAGVGFFVAFAYLIVDFIFLHPPGAIVAIVSLLLARQVMGRAAGVVGDFYSLQKQRIKLDALFFHSKVLMPQLPGIDKGIWALLRQEKRQDWVVALVTELGLSHDDKDEVVCTWLQIGQIDVGVLVVTVGTSSYLLKLYDFNRTAWARHEMALLSEEVSSLPSLALIGTRVIEKHHCLVYAFPDGEKPNPKAVKETARQLRIRILAAPPPASLIDHYQRSRPMLWRRFTPEFLKRLTIAANTEEQRLGLARILRQLPQIQGLLSLLPLVVLNPDLRLDAMWLMREGEVLSLHWGRWSLEPLGAGWPATERELEQLTDVLQEASAHRKELADVQVSQVELAALVFACERECNRQRFTQALELLPKMLKRLDAFEE